MPLFKDTVALETCPAKTAETVSYGATLLVLAGLLLANFANSSHIPGTKKAASELTTASALSYLRLENKSEPSVIIASNAEQNPLEPEAIPTEDEYAEASTNVQFPSSIDRDSSSLVFALGTLSESLEPPTTNEQQPMPENSFMLQQKTGLPGFIYENTIEVAFSNQALRAFGLDLTAEERLSPLMVASTAYTMPQNSQHEEMLHSGSSSASTVATEVREITVSASETERLLNRPNKIQRPRLPISSRPQPAQIKAILLPPRVQALRP
jgi:hypothetical protein